MPHDFNKPSHVQTPEERQKKKRVPLYILALVGIFLIALLFYMFAEPSQIRMRRLQDIRIRVQSLQHQITVPLQQQVTKRQPTIAIRRLQQIAKCE